MKPCIVRRKLVTGGADSPLDPAPVVIAPSSSFYRSRSRATTEQDNMDCKRKRSLLAARCGNHAQTITSPESSWISGVSPTPNSCPESTSSSIPLLHSFIRVNRLHIRAQLTSLKFRWNNRFIRESSPTLRKNPSPTSFLALRVLVTCHLPDPVLRVPATCSVSTVDVASNPWTGGV
uniref:(northern house mosquito) hypothetical protein n=2 Tax=Culex pipiens TaxID=7175 RepID=A0A8D8JJ05_CULPI